MKFVVYILPNIQVYVLNMKRNNIVLIYNTFR